MPTPQLRVELAETVIPEEKSGQAVIKCLVLEFPEEKSGSSLRYDLAVVEIFVSFDSAQEPVFKMQAAHLQAEGVIVYVF